VANDPNLRWRLRYDLVANAVVLQVQKAIDFNADVAGSGNANLVAVASALTNSTSGNASDEWSNVLNTLAALTPAQRVASYNTFSGEAIADTSTATMQANMLFADLLRQRIGDGDQLSGTAFAQSSLGDVRVAATKVDDKFASQLVAGSDSESRSGAGMWAQGFGSYQAIDGQKGTHDFNATVAGIAAGFEARNGNLTAGVAGGLTQVDGNVDALASTLSGTLYQIGGYASFDNGHAFVSASGNYYQGDFDTARTVSLGGNALSARGSFDSDGYAFGGVAGYRFDLGNKVRLVAVASANQTHDDRSSFTEKGAGGLNLSAAASGRDLFTATGELRLGTSVKTGASVAMPYVTIGVRYNAGDLDTVGNMRFASAPLGTGAFQVTGARVAPWMGTVGTGIDVKANDTVRMGVALEAAKGDHVTEGRASVRIKIGF
jgi:outer membrane autotransporter protein